MQEKLISRLFEELRARFESAATRGSVRSLECGIEALWQELIDQVDDEAYTPALRRLKTETNNLPTADRVQRVLLEETKKLRAAAEKNRLDRWYKNKGGETRAELDQAPSLFSRPQQIEMAADAVALLRRIPLLSKLERVQAHQELADRYPGSTFALTREELRNCFTIKEHWQPIEDAPPPARRRLREERLQAEEELAEVQRLGLMK